MSDAHPAPPPAAPDGPGRKPGFLAAFRQHLLHPEMTPHQVALSFGIGFSLAWNPLLGLHTSLILILCFIFRRLHRPLMFLACYLNNPWTMVPMASASAVLGNVLLGRGWHLNLGSIHWHSLGWRSFATREGFDAMLLMLKPILLPYLLGGALLSALALPVGYYVMLTLARRLRRRHLSQPACNPHDPK